MKGALAIVDAFSTGRHLAPVLRGRGWTCLHVQSLENPPGFIAGSFVATDFSTTLVHTGDVSELAQALRNHGVQAIVPGCEMGVPLCDVLNDTLGLPWNQAATTTLRRNKYSMLEAVRQHGLRAPAQRLVSARADLDAWLRERQAGEYPIVVKPADSSGTDGVVFCDTPAETVAAVDSLLGRTNLMGLPNDEVLVQTFLRGTEWVVNTVSWQSRHRVTDIWRLQKCRVDGAGFIYDYDQLMPRTGADQNALVDYVRHVLDAVGVEYGPAHTEVMLTGDGPVLIEVGARAQGAIDPTATLHGAGTNQLVELANALEAPARFTSETPETAALRAQVLLVQLITRTPGVVHDLPLVRALKRLPTHFSSHLAVQVGDTVRPTIDLFSSPGWVYLAGPDVNALFRDYRIVRRLEHRGIEVRAG